MTNNDKYKRAFSVLHASSEIPEVTIMEKTRKFYIHKAVALCAAVVMIMGLATVAYAADVGNIQRHIQVWMHGDKTDAVLDFNADDNSYTSYTLTYEDSDGTLQEQHGGGIAFEPDGTQRALNEQELIEHLDEPEVDFRADGTVWLYYHDKVFDITENFEDTDTCYLQLKEEKDTSYITIRREKVGEGEYQGGYAFSPYSFEEID